MLNSDLCFDPEPIQRTAAKELYATIKDLPFISPHGHIDPALFSVPNTRFGNPVEELIQHDHYFIRMLASQGIVLDEVFCTGDPRKVWRLFANNFHLYRGTPSSLWFTYTLENTFGITEKLDSSSSDSIFDQIDSVLSSPRFTPRSQFEKMNIEMLATTDPATSGLENHKAMRTSGWNGKIIPTFRADNLINLQTQGWLDSIHHLSTVSGIEVSDYKSFIQAIQQRRTSFKELGAKATDSSTFLPETGSLSPLEVEAVFQNALKGQVSPFDAARFSAHMLMEMASMSADDGLVMQLHSGIFRNHNPIVFQQFGGDVGFDIPVRAEFTQSLKPMLDRFGSLPNFTLIVFTLDESLYTRELAPLAGAYPALKVGSPWWFHDSWNGMKRYFDQVMETAGLYNTSGFVDDTRSLLSIPARQDVWRRASANWVAGLLVRHLIDRMDAETMVIELAVGLAKRAYRVE